MALLQKIPFWFKIILLLFVIILSGVAFNFQLIIIFLSFITREQFKYDFYFTLESFISYLFIGSLQVIWFSFIIPFTFFIFMVISMVKLFFLIVFIILFYLLLSSMALLFYLSLTFIFNLIFFHFHKKSHTIFQLL